MSTTYYICKYTPVELLEALGGTCQVLDEMPDNFSLSDQMGHPNLCGFGKSVLEACLSGQVKELVLVNCCDTIRSVYDILAAKGEMDFLFLLDMLHTSGPRAVARTKAELLWLAETYAAYKGTTFDPNRFRSAFRPSERPEGPYLSVMGGRVGDKLFQTMTESMPLPVCNDTCVHDRFVPPPEGDETDLEALMEPYAQALLEQVPCMRMTDVTGRESLRRSSDLRGIIYHTVKFCDYYGFEYSKLRKDCGVPLLKLESDYTVQSSGQLRTRLEAFAESLSPETTLTRKGRGQVKKGYFAGIDSGSTSTDVAILDQDKRLVAQVILPTGAGAAAGAERAMEAALAQAGLKPEDITATVTTGYGRSAIQLGDKSITEITCHAKGAFFLDPTVRTIIDIGGQDSKVIRVDETGNVVNFIMNDKCAAGTGRFLELMARTLELSLDEMSTAGLSWKEDITISSMCTVFAESEVVSLIAQNKRTADIVHGLNEAVAAKTCALCKRLGGEPSYMMTGGVSKNRGVAEAIQRRLGAPLHISDAAQLNGALGAALFAMELA